MERHTRQRRIICHAVESTGRPLSPIEIYEESRILLPSIGIATIYRAIRDLLNSGWLKSVNVLGGPVRYERAGQAHHHHFLCRNCDTLWDIHSCPTDIGNIAPDGFVTEGHEIILYGLCNDCGSLV